MVHGILQFTPSIAFRYVLHRCESRDIRCQESLCFGMTLLPVLGSKRTIQSYVAWRIPRPNDFAGQWPPERGYEPGIRKQGWDAPGCLSNCVYMLAGRSAITGFDNDPSAGSPTETLLRLLLPLNDKVQWTSFDVASSKPPTSPQSEHFTGPFNR